MAKKTFQSISIRLLRDGVPPADSLRSGLTLSAWPKLENSLISLGTSKAQIPKWAPFLELADEDLTRLKNMMAFGLLFFVPAAQRWFAISFGCGHTKLDPDAFEHDFGLRIVLNAVHPDKLRSADIRTPDDNTTSRRTQTRAGRIKLLSVLMWSEILFAVLRGSLKIAISLQKLLVVTDLRLLGKCE